MPTGFGSHTTPRLDNRTADCLKKRFVMSQNSKLMAPFVFEGSCNTKVVDTYFEKVLLPAIPKAGVIIFG
jgi:hypothetical protein